LKLDNSKNVAVVLDFDGTLIPIKKPVMVAVDTQATPLSARPELDAMRELYSHRLHGGLLTPKEERSWFLRTLDIYAKHRLHMKEVRRALSDIRLKPGVKKTLLQLREINVPVAIVSYSVRQFVEIVLRNNRALHLVDKIYAAVLIIDAADGRTCDYRPSTVVLPTLKGVWSRNFAYRHDVPKGNILAVGDTYGDRFLGSRKCNRLGLVTGADSYAHLHQHMGKIIVNPHGFHEAGDWLFERIAHLRR
jgi:phosphoglycolate phosphatase-like HAD superfamily hydrolase